LSVAIVEVQDLGSLLAILFGVSFPALVDNFSNRASGDIVFVCEICVGGVGFTVDASDFVGGFGINFPCVA
jgi:hypothetical protein